MLGVRVGSVESVDVEALRHLEVTYAHVGSTLGGEPPGRRHESSLRIGRGPEAFAAARGALRSWVPQRSLGASVRPHGVRPDLGETALLGFGPGGRGLLVPTRVVAVVDEPRRYAYAYGTLPGHPEVGEEVFLVEHGVDDEVVMTIRIDALPAPALRPVAPVVRVLQRAALERYLRAVRRAAR